MRYFKCCLLLIGSFWLGAANAAAWVEGVPIAVQKTDYGSLKLIYIRFLAPLATDAPCDDKSGVVIMDDNPSAKAALSFAMTALTSGNKFSCYINTNQCSAITGAPTTFPVCEYYPALIKK